MYYVLCNFPQERKPSISFYVSSSVFVQSLSRSSFLTLNFKRFTHTSPVKLIFRGKDRRFVPLDRTIANVCMFCKSRIVPFIFKNGFLMLFDTRLNGCTCFHLRIVYHMSNESCTRLMLTAD